MQDIRSIFTTRWREMKRYFKAFTLCSFQSYLNECEKYKLISHNSIKLTCIGEDLHEIPIIYSLPKEEITWMADLKMCFESDKKAIVADMIYTIHCGEMFISHMKIFKQMMETDLLWICYEDMMEVASEVIHSYVQRYVKEATNAHMLKQCMMFLDETLLPWFLSVFHYDCKYHGKP
jgi:hypothetical protein